MSLLDKPQTLSIALGRRIRNARHMLRSWLTSLTGFSAFVPDHVSVAPRDLKTADPLMAEEFYRGRYVLAGSLVETGGKSPFLVKDTELSWKVALHEFGWLRHLSAKRDTLSASHARASIKDWVEVGSIAQSELAWRHDIAGKRLISWLCHSDMILTNSDHEFHSLFMRTLAAHVRFLKRYAPTAPEGMSQIISYLALSYASVCHHNQQNALQFARERLGRELAHQVFADGGHMSRNPKAIVDLLTLLLPFRQACTAVGVETPSDVVIAIERMLPALRFFRLGDGGLARFNGCGVVQNDLIATLLRYDEALGEPLLHASQSGYQRLTGSQTILLMDVGDPARGEVSVQSHAGCLAFEFSSGTDCIVVNCGVPLHPGFETSALWRTTAAHSTAVFCETSSCRFENTGAEKLLLDGQILTTNLNAQSDRKDDPESSTVTASHLGYAREFGALHQRTLSLDHDGMILTGQDWFTGPDKANLKYSTRDAVAIHFHLHPDVRVAMDPSTENACIIETRQKQRWQFICNEVKPSIEESIFFATLSGVRARTFQIVLHLNASGEPEVNWTFRRIR